MLLSEITGLKLVRALLAVFTVVVVVLLQSAFWLATVSSGVRVALVLVAITAYFRPRMGLLLLAGLIPLGQIGSRSLDAQMRGAEGLVLAFLAGVLVRGWTLRELRSFPSTRLEAVALVFAFIVASSCVEQIWLLQIQTDYPWMFAQTIWTYASGGYLSTSRGFEPIFRAMLLLEGLALLVYTARHVRHDDRFASQLIVMLALGAAIAASVGIMDVAVRYSDPDVPSTSFTDYITGRRWPIHIGDMNASGSYFAMMLLICVGVALAPAARRLLWVPLAIIVALAFWLAGSRTALFAILATGATSIIGMMVRKASKTQRISAMVLLMVTVASLQYFPAQLRGPGAAAGISIRWLFLRTTINMVRAEPIFGVGIGQYAERSDEFIPPGLKGSTHASENAHNNFGQIVGELGVIGLISFGALLIMSFAAGSASVHASGWIVLPVTFGLAAFILTWLGGHPLLVPEVAYPFWVILGVVVGCALNAVPVTGRQMAVVITIFGVLTLSIPVRVHTKVGRLDFSRVRYGLSGDRLIASRMRVFVPGAQQTVELPLRARRGDRPVEIDVSVDGEFAKRVALSDNQWERVRIDIRNGTRQLHEIELQVDRSPTDEDSEAGELRRVEIEVRQWERLTAPGQ